MFTEERTFSREERSERRARGGAIRRYARLRLWVGVTDVLSMAGAIFLALLIRHGLRPFASRPQLLISLAVVSTLAVFAAFHLYDISRLSPAEEFRRLVTAVSLTVGVLVVLAFWSKATYSRPVIALTWGLSLALVLITRRLWHWHMGRLRGRGDLMFRTLIVGTNREAEHLVEAMQSPTLGFHVLGYVTTDGTEFRHNGLPVFGDLSTIQQAIKESGADCVFVASGAVSSDGFSRITKAVRLEGVEVRVSANISNILATRLTVQQMGQLMTLSLKPVRLSGFQAAAKRTMDIVLSLAALILTLPVTVAVAAAIKIDSRGPVVYRQERVGRDGRWFQMLKFRTMVRDAESMLESLRALNEATGPLFKLRKDPRVTAVGRLLRKWSIDEWPQLWNVLRGEMSLVGPRPPLPAEVDQYEDWHMDRLAVRPGITGLWQVRGRSELPFDDYVRLDLYYIENWSISYDLFILAKTVPAILISRGAY